MKKRGMCFVMLVPQGIVSSQPVAGPCKYAFLYHVRTEISCAIQFSNYPVSYRVHVERSTLWKLSDGYLVIRSSTT